MAKALLWIAVGAFVLVGGAVDTRTAAPTLTLQIYFDGGYYFDLSQPDTVAVHALKSANLPMIARIVTDGSRYLPPGGFTVTLRPDGAVPRATKPRVPPLDAQATGCADMDRKLPNKNNRLFIPNLDEAAVAMGTVVRKDAAMSATIRLTGGELSVDDLGGCVEYRRPDGTAVQPKHSMASGIEGILYEWRGLPATSVMLVRTDAAGVEKADALRPNANGLIVLRVSSFAASAMSRLAPYAIAHFKAHFDGAFKTIDERRRVSLWWLETYKTSPGIDCPPGGTGP